ncbi:hypothetical protein CEXT_292501 [Caerostris extrusa]|uniref:Uncharacterized protein n=1 Tax=Caerostris extrusa TaxID=172846 RepID=A0AAV4W7C2_CAEEX|nr:hypothetical protein CEXT_292501 [Caerostris extrusa]
MKEAIPHLPDSGVRCGDGSHSRQDTWRQKHHFGGATFEKGEKWENCFCVECGGNNTDRNPFLRDRVYCTKIHGTF